MNHTGTRAFIGATALFLSALASAAPPLELSDRGWYGGVLAGALKSDSVRDADEYAPAFSLFGGRYLIDVLGAELHLSGHFPQSRSSGANDPGFGAGLDFNLGLPEAVAPFVILGGGGLFEQAPGGATVSSPYVNYGLGLYLPNPFFSASLIRLEARYQRVFHNKNDAGCVTVPCSKDDLEDLRFGIGLQFGSDFDTPPIVAPPPTSPPPPDSDRDGVIDPFDACPGTPLGTVVDEKGCPPPPPPARLADSDGDGVPDSFDQCANTPAATVVDEKGCPLPPPAPITPPVVDSDGDGVLDSADQCANTPREFQVDDVGCVKVETLVLENVAFGFNSAKLTAEGSAALASVASSLKAHPSLIVEVDGHTDAVGGDAVNVKLSQKRANSVRDYLIAQGVTPARLTAEGYGKSRPIADNKTEEGRARNRRVEFKVLKQ